MPSFVALNSVSYSTPDGQTLFQNLNLAFGPVRTGLVGRNGTGKSTLLKLLAGELLPAAGDIAVSGTLRMLRQSVQVDDATVADAFGATAALRRLARLEAGHGDVDDAAEADWTLPARIEAALERLHLPGLTPGRPLATLSGGQRTRIALAALVFDAPDLLLLDEPTNNLDADGRLAVAEVLRNWRGGAIVVSHDRELLRQMDAIVELTTLGAKTYGGNYDTYTERKALELAAAEHTLATAERHVTEIDKRIQATRERQARRDGAGARKASRGDIPKIMLGARRENAQKTSGDQAQLAGRQRAEATAEAADARAQVEILQKVSLKLAPTHLPAGKTVLEAHALTGGPDPHNPIIRNFSVQLIGPERVAVTGPNGAGKTTLLRLLTSTLPPVSGSVHIASRYALLDQTVSLLNPSLTIRDNFRILNPGDDENAGRAALARFMFRADAALQSVASLSGGEMLRAGLACTLGGNRPPELLILDEPTNHLDLTAISAVEAGLSAYDGALLVVSHDRPFLEAVGITRTIAL
ncbi:MAG TPA: ABC-F family ATP-binding cassette domain-containing protein [Devosiaceae bacterium]|jgi:ATPase subunit of ABC transporter with duplicated ATPase domains